MLISLATGIIYFSWVITGLSLSLGLIILIIGLPFVALFMLSVRGLARLIGRAHAAYAKCLLISD